MRLHRAAGFYNATMWQRDRRAGDQLNMERRNHYRILHVQPDAPTETIRASYRSLMGKLRQHPDLGGSHEMAVALNRAYHTLSDPGRRRAYDLELSRVQRAPWTRAPAAPAVQGGPVRRRGGDRPLSTGGIDPQAGRCSFCSAPAPATRGPDPRCPCCGAPLASVSHRFRAARGADERRAVPRVGRDDTVMVYRAWGYPPARGRLCDLSPAGVGLLTEENVAAGDVVRIIASGWDLVTRVVQIHERDGRRSLHGEFLAVRFAERSGVFLSVQA